MSTRDYRYSITEYEQGGTESPKVKIASGQVWRMRPDKDLAFSSCTVIGIANGTHGDFWVRLARPYAYASGAGTTSPSVLMGCEVFEVTTKTFVERFQLQIEGDGYTT